MGRIGDNLDAHYASILLTSRPRSVEAVSEV